MSYGHPSKDLDAGAISPRSAISSIVLFGLSLGVHAAFFGLLGALPKNFFTVERPPEVAFEVIETPPPPEPPPEIAPEPAPPPPPPEPEAPRVRSTTIPEDAVFDPEPPPPLEAPPEPAAPLQESPVDFGNLTLTNDNGSFTVAASSGQAMDGPIGRPGAVTGRRVDGTADGSPNGSGAAAAIRTVALADLSRRPESPSGIESKLERNYPSAARTQGIEGESVARIRIGADGRIERIRIESETGQNGFGEACKRALRDAGNWTPPLDRAGQAVATEVRFVCAFEVRY